MQNQNDEIGQLMVGDSLGGFQNDANTLLLFKPNASDGDISFVDLSSLNRTLTRYSPAEHSDVQKYVGTTSLLCDGSGAAQGSAVIANSWGFAVAANSEFNIRTYIQRVAETTERSVALATFSTSSNDGFVFRVFNNKLNFIYVVSGSAVVNITGTTTVTKDAWHKVEVDRQESGGIYTVRIRLNDSVEGSVVYAGSIIDGGNGTSIGARPLGGAQARFYSFNGYIDNLQISNISRI